MPTMTGAPSIRPGPIARLVAGASLVVLAVACGSDSSPQEQPAPVRAADGAEAGSTPGAGGDAAAAQAASTRHVDPRKGGLELGFGEYAITMEADEIRPGPVTFVIRNGGAMIHGFEIEAEGDDDGDHSGPGHGELKLEGPAMQPGGTVRIDADLPPGVYKVECFVDGHDDLGMEAILVVRDDAPLVTLDDPADSPGAVEIVGFAFAPDVVVVASGTEVRWTNDDPAAHTVSADDGSFDSGTLDPSDGFSYRFGEPGTYTYRCEIHPTMRGTVRVT